MADEFDENAKDIIVQYVDAVGYQDGLIRDIAAALRAEYKKGFDCHAELVRDLNNRLIDKGHGITRSLSALDRFETQAESRGFARGVGEAAKAICAMCAQNREGEPYKRGAAGYWWHAGPAICGAGLIHDLKKQKKIM